MDQHVPGVQGIPADLGGQLHIFQGGEVLHQVVKLEHKADIMPPVGGELLGVIVADPCAVHGDGAAGAGIHAAQHVEHGSLARAGGTYDDGELPLVHGEVHPIHRFDGNLTHSVLFLYVFKGYVAHKALRLPAGAGGTLSYCMIHILYFFTRKRNRQREKFKVYSKDRDLFRPSMEKTSGAGRLWLTNRRREE